MPRIITVCPFSPFPIVSGDRKRLRGLLRALGRDHDVTLIAPEAPDPDEDLTPEGVVNWIRVAGDPKTESFPRRLAQRLREEITTGAVDGVVCWGHTVPLAIDYRISVPVIVDQSLLPTMLASRAAATAGFRIRSRRYFRRLEAIRRSEFRALLPRYHFVACSEEDRRALLELGSGQVSVVENFADEDLFPYRIPSEARVPGSVVLLGPFDSLHNHDSLLWFARRVVPHLRRQVDPGRVLVVGRLPDSRARRAAEKAGLTIRGWVDDIGATLAEASIFALPLRIGSGTKTRVLDAGILELPTVTTPIGAEGFPIRHRQHALVTPRPAELADAIAEVLASPLLARTLGRELRALVLERFREAQVTAVFRDLVGSLVKEVTSPRGARAVHAVSERS